MTRESELANWSWSVAVRYTDLNNLGTVLERCRAAGAVAGHFDVGDGRYLRSFGLGLDIVRSVVAARTLPADLHLQAHDADDLVPSLIDAGCASITIQVECLTHSHRAMALIRNAGIEAGLAIGSTTPLTAVEHLLPSVDRVLLVARDPDSKAGLLPPSAFERVKILRDNLNYHSRKIRLEVEGATEPRDIAQLTRLGADRIVLSNAELLKEADLGASLGEFVKTVHAQSKVV